MAKRALLVALLLVAAVVVIWLATPDVFRADSERSTLGARGGDTPIAEPRTETGDELPAPPPLPPPVDLATVDLDRDLHGMVVQKDGGAPVAGAEISVVTYPWRRASLLNTADHDTTVAGPETLSASDGTFRLRLRRGERVALRVSAEGYVPVELVKRTAGERVTVELQHGILVRVVVREPGNLPAVDAGVELTRRGHFTLKGRTGEDGACVFEAVPGGGAVRLTIEPQRYARPSNWHRNHDLPETGEHTLEAQLESGRTIQGTVTDAVTNRPIAGARVGCGWWGHRPVMTGEDGRYTIEHWSGKEGWSDISVDAPGYGQAVQDVKTRDEVNFALVPGASARGRVVDTAGKPIAGVMVGAVGSKRVGDEQKTSRRHAVTDNEGRFALNGLRDDMNITVTLMKPGYGRHLTDFAPSRESTDLGDITMPRAGAIEGVVLDGNDAPMPRVEVILRGANADRYRLVGDTPRRGYFFYGNTESIFTDHLGRFRFPNQSPGQFVVAVRLKGAPERTQSVTLPADTERVDVQVKFAGLRRFTVWVHDEDGRPLRAYIWLQTEGSRRPASLQTNSAGAAVFLVTGPIQNINPPHVDEGAYLPAEPKRNIESDQTEVRFVMKRGARISGRVVSEGKPLNGAVFDAMRDGVSVGTGYSHNGEFSMVVPPGAVVDLVLKSVQVAMPGRGVAVDETGYAGELKAVAAGATDVILRATKVAKDRTMSVRVVRPDDTPVRGLHVSVRGTPGGITNADGVVTLAALPAKPVHIVAGMAATETLGSLVFPTLDPVEPSGQKLVVKLIEGFAYRGIVVLPDGTPAAKGARVHAFVQQRGFRARTDAAGRFTIYMPPDLQEPFNLGATVRVKTKTYTGHVSDVKPGSTAELRIELRASR